MDGTKIQLDIYDGYICASAHVVGQTKNKHTHTYKHINICFYLFILLFARNEMIHFS